MLHLVLCLVFVVHRARAGCNPSNGPAGGTDCIQIPRYNNQYQWGTCLTNTYIKQKSNQQHACENRYATYCYYQCMIEVHKKNSGPVSKDCSCTPSSQQTTARPLISPTTSLPPECYSPSGASCQWYRDCLEKKYPCEATSNAYAIKYAEHFCDMYNKHRLLFSSKAQQWIDGVRKCLQVALVPLLRPWRSPTCQEIRQVAFNSHTPCYLKPDQGAPSVCDLGCLEYFKILFVIKGAFVDGLDTAWESLKGMWNIGNKCGIQCSRNWIRESSSIKVIKIGIQLLKRRSRRSSDAPLPDADAQSRFADKVGRGIANSLKWNSEVMDWLAYPAATNHPAESSHVTIHVVLADKKGLGIVTTILPSVNLNEAIQELSAAIQQGKLPLTIGDSNVWLQTLDACSDKSCNETKSLAVASKMPEFNNAAAVKDGGFLKCLLTITVLSVMLFTDKLCY